MKIDWAELAVKMNCPTGGGSDLACVALAEILGTDTIIEAVEHYFSQTTGSELARSVLWQLHPRVAIDYCYKTYKQDSDLERRRSAVELLRVVDDGTALNWLPEFLTDPDPDIQTWGAGIVDQLLFSGHSTAQECETVLETMKVHKNPGVRRYYDLAMEYLRRNDSEQDRCT